MRLTLLGTPGLEGLPDEVAGSICQGQPFALLAVLACAGDRGYPRDKLLALFWPEAPADRAAHRFNQLAHSVRRRLGDPDLILGAGELLLDPGRFTCDLWDLVAARTGGQLERAAELYTGPLLDGFYLPDNPEVERWLEHRRSALAREHAETLEALALGAEVRGDLRAAATWWRRLAEHEPLSTRVMMRLMNALAASGDRARALEWARAYEAQVREQVDAEPNLEVLALATRLKVSPRPTLALGVLPVEPLDEGAAARRFAQGLTEELTSAAARLPGVRVAARTSLMALRQETGDLKEIGARLGLSAMLESTIRTDGEVVRLMVRLVDVRDGCQIWSGSFERQMGEGFQEQEGLAKEVVGSLRDCVTAGIDLSSS